MKMPTGIEEKHCRQRFINTKSLGWGNMVGAIEELGKVRLSGVPKAWERGYDMRLQALQGPVTQLSWVMVKRIIVRSH